MIAMSRWNKAMCVVAGRLGRLFVGFPGVLDLLGEMVEEVCRIAASEWEWSDGSHG